MVFLGMKRGREADHQLDTITTMANCLMLLSRGGGEFDSADNSPSRVFECKTCNRQFPSFQALGGHRASHKRPRFVGGDLDGQVQLLLGSPQPKPKTHECPICGIEFAIGQALGGHMRRHRTAASTGDRTPDVPVVKKSNSRRVLCLDLNLTPGENGLDFEKVVPMLHCYL